MSGKSDIRRDAMEFFEAVAPEMSPCTCMAEEHAKIVEDEVFILGTK